MSRNLIPKVLMNSTTGNIVLNTFEMLLKNETKMAVYPSLMFEIKARGLALGAAP